MPQASVDPVVMAAATVLRLQTVVSREVAPSDAAVVTVGCATGRHQGKRDPEITRLDRYDLVRNDEQATERVRVALAGHLGDARVIHTGPASASEDFGSFRG